ncbi:magnesium/cobalt transporter CorA [Carboxylicivirga sp. A043]|uniref:magnesium/cobalt transporter CorA n=1 Tax=Carboxylicivirga litoralis TaxID=2816963 RepID=UPI0021CB4738|nr:magnesium/cobalt transporter CorA [Carboxylicivirga sp. A043]MCU4155508.1 magnesium/cobalt transporter CorA [Carboxylicivirga sp. A043]
MARFLKSNKEHIGLSPDSIQFRGEQKTERVFIQAYNYDSKTLVEDGFDEVEKLSAFINQGNSWINIYGLHDTNVMQKVSEVLDIESIVISEILNTHSRPRVVEYDNCLFVSLKLIRILNEDDLLVDNENIVFILKDKQLITFQERRGDVFNPVRERLKNPKRKIRQLGSDYLLFALLDVIIDNYSYAISCFGELVEELDEKVLGTVDNSMLADINHYKIELIYLHKSIVPCKEMVLNLIKLESDYIEEEKEIFFRELQSNIQQAIDSLNNYKEILTNQLSIYHTQVSSRLNDIMRVLTIFSVVFIPLTFIAGIYGTNFEYIPELGFRQGYPAMIGVMVMIAIGMLVYFKRKKWY